MRATSRDGTSIEYVAQGDGPPVVLVGGGLDDGTENVPLAAALADTFTVYNYARRGRAGSGNTLPYAVDREIEDLAALVDVAGERVGVLGVSSGAMFALEAAAAGVAIDRVAAYDVPYDTYPDAAARADDYRRDLADALSGGRRDEAVALFMRFAGAGDDDVTAARESPYWPGLVTLAPTLAHDAALYGPPPADRLATIRQPALVVTGEASGFFADAAAAVAELLPGASLRTLAGAGHVPAPEVIGPVLREFFLP
ncbi:alpha/beta hydrolase [Asanoa sp. NPDC050611]|uniref:alpha/beta fold hydrolase n=1 Tax=Asanoa sp. NPDC050611 TaxID=3157098 RepID=UPI0033D23694